MINRNNLFTLLNTNNNPRYKLLDLIFSTKDNHIEIPVLCFNNFINVVTKEIRETEALNLANNMFVVPIHYLSETKTRATFPNILDDNSYLCRNNILKFVNKEDPSDFCYANNNIVIDSDLNILYLRTVEVFVVFRKNELVLNVKSVNFYLNSNIFIKESFACNFLKKNTFKEIPKKYDSGILGVNDRANNISISTFIIKEFYPKVLIEDLNKFKHSTILPTESLDDIGNTTIKNDFVISNSMRNLLI